MTKSINHMFTKSDFPKELKKLKVIPVYKKEDALRDENYRHVSLLSHVSKVFGRIISKQITNYMENKLSKYITGFRKSHGTQHSLITMLKNRKVR